MERRHHQESDKHTGKTFAQSKPSLSLCIRIPSNVRVYVVNFVAELKRHPRRRIKKPCGTIVEVNMEHRNVGTKYTATVVGNRVTSAEARLNGRSLLLCSKGTKS